MAGSAGFWLLAKLSGGMVCGVALGLCVNESVMAIIHTGKTLIGGVVFFVIPLVIFGFIAPTVLSLKASAGRMLGSFLVLSYLSSVGASLFATAMGRVVIPYLRIPRTVEGLRTIPKVIFTLEIPSLMPVVTALAFALLVGLSALWVKARAVEQVLYEFRRMMGEAISRVLVPLLPFFVAATFAELAYSGSLTRQLPLFAKVVAVVIVGHLLWLC
ncbi:dicarboxylate/amino acid:cation symporter, partial [Treponema pallidum]